MADSTPPSPTIERRDCATAEELLDWLSPRHPLWQAVPQAWIFRGQSKDWPLKAKAHREGDWFQELGLPMSLEGEPRWALEDHQVNLMLIDFSDELDRAGLPVPARGPQLFRGTSWESRSGEPEREALPTLALAQHLGLPTPWLDWSLQARSAAYFACSDLVWKKDAEPGRMVVWALRRHFVQATEDVQIGDTWLTVEAAPRAGNARLHAQSGLFTWLRGESASATSVENYVESLAALPPEALKRGQVFDPPYMRCFTLDRAHAPQLLGLLSQEGVTAASVFPGYEGVVQALKERGWLRAKWPRPTGAPLVFDR